MQARSALLVAQSALLAAARIAALAAALAAASPVAAQTKAKKRVLPPPRPATVLVVPAPKAAAPAPGPVPLRLGGLVGMSPVGDAAPACRAQCSKDRYVCHAAGDPTDCDSRWIPCLHACTAR